MSKKICTVGIISWCDIERYPNRFEVFKDCVSAFKRFIPKNSCKTVIIDNNSSFKVKKYIKSLNCFDKKIILPENIHDIGIYAVLMRICEENQTDYFLPIENDFVFFRGDFIDPSIKMLKRSPNCGYLRLLKFSFTKRNLFDKLKVKLKSPERPNAVRMYNMITKEKLFWAGPIIDKNNNHFYINNWHWQTFGSLIHINIWKKIFPRLKRKIPAYQQAELIMMKNYQKLGLQTLVLDGGAFSHKDPQSMYQTSRSGGVLVASSKIKFYMNSYKNFLVR